MLVTCLFPQGSIPCTSPANYICKASCKLSLASERHGGRFEDGRKRVHSLSLPLPLPWAVSLAVVSSLVLAPVQQPLFLALLTAHLLFFLPALGMVVAPCVANLWVASPFHSIFQLFQPLYTVEWDGMALPRANRTEWSGLGWAGVGEGICIGEQGKQRGHPAPWPASSLWLGHVPHDPGQVPGPLRDCSSPQQSL